MKEKVIESYLFSCIEKEKLFENINGKDERDAAEKYLQNAINDAEFALNFLEPYLKTNMKILEVGGGLHLLSSYLHFQGYDITSIEPGDFTLFVNKLRKNILKVLNKTTIYTTTLENFQTKHKYDFIFSINVLEHTNSILEHINCQRKLLSDYNSKALFRAPNYNIPFEPHFYKFFIPSFPTFTFEKLYKKNLVKEFGEERYREIYQSLNFDCKYTYINKNFSITIKNPLSEIFQRLKNDDLFSQRILKNNKIKAIYKLINQLKLYNFLKIFPKRFYPYLIFVINRDS